MIDPHAVQLVRSVAHAVFGVDIATERTGHTAARVKNICMMALHDEFDFSQTDAAATFGNEPATFTHARESLANHLETDAHLRAKAGLFFRVLDREMRARQLISAR